MVHVLKKIHNLLTSISLPNNEFCVILEYTCNKIYLYCIFCAVYFVFCILWHSTNHIATRRNFVSLEYQPTCIMYVCMYVCIYVYIHTSMYAYV